MTTRTHHPLANIAEWRKGCSCAATPVQCEACTEGLIKAVEHWFTQDRSTSTEVLASLQSYLVADARVGGQRKSTKMVNLAYQHIEDLDAQLYAAQDQVEGLQELMRANTIPAILDTAVRYLVATAESDPDNDLSGSPQHGHRIAGRWDGDGTNRKGTLCEECAAWNTMRKYAATDIAAEAQVIEDVRVTQLLATLKRADGIITMLMPGSAKVFNLDIQELNEGCMEIAQALAIKKGAAQ